MLSVDNVVLHYGDAQALGGVSLDVPKGSIVAIVGANGAGKTSLIRAIGGMLPVTSGRIRFEDADITGLEIPTGQPIVYELDDQLQRQDRYYLSER